MIDKALVSLRPGAQWALNGDDYEGLVWMDETQSQPTKAEVLAEVARLRAELARTEYKHLRAAEYPSIGDQLDALYHAGVFPPDMEAKIAEIKSKYPKSV